MSEVPIERDGQIATSEVLIERDGQIANITLNRPDRKAPGKTN